MKLNLLSTIFGAALILSTVVSNTPELCTNDIQYFVNIRTSECDPTGHVGTNIMVGTTLYNNDEHHMFIVYPCKAGKARKKPKTSKKRGNQGSDGNIVVNFPVEIRWFWRGTS